MPLDEPFPEAAVEYLGRGRYIHDAVPCDEPIESVDTQSTDL